MTLSEWLDKIAKIHVTAIDLGLQRVLPLAQQLQLTHFSMPVVMVAGTNGKGSVVRTLESIYQTAGYRVAAYTSPHLLHFTERLHYNAKPVAESDWVAEFETVEALRQQQQVSLSFFEFTTLAALRICQRLEPQLLLLEVGLGGRLDAVNVVEADLAVITNVALDHTEWLGGDREQIAFEKAGIIRAKRPVICGDPELPANVLQIALKHEAPLYCYQIDYNDESTQSTWTWHGPHNTFLALPKCQLKRQNVATALMATQFIDLPVNEYALRLGISRANLAGRYQRYQACCPVILDVAHNPQAVQLLVERLRQEEGIKQIHAVTGMLKDKDISTVLNTVDPLISRWSFASLEVPRGASANDLAGYLKSQGVKSCYTFGSVKAAIQHSLSQAAANHLVLVFGSFHTVAEALIYLNANDQPNHQKGGECTNALKSV